MANIDWRKLFFSIFITQMAGGIGAIATTPKIPTWYTTLNQPVFRPPNWVFGPVWTTLFLLMGISFYLIFTSTTKKNKSSAIKFFFLQLLLNILWSYLFFGLESPLLGFIEIIIFWFSILFTIISFQKISRIASYLLYPYLAWVSFATILNGAIFWLNR